MAFLCPVRIGKAKRKKASSSDKLHQAPSIGRITGSASIETLVRVGLEKEHGLSADSKVVVLHDFTPCVDDELRVRRGQVVNLLYQENDWVYVIAENGEEGFIPHSYCAAFGSQMGELALLQTRKKFVRDSGGGGVNKGESAHSLDSGGVSDSESNCGLGGNTNAVVNNAIVPDVHPFFKDPAGRYVVLYTFVARDENDVSVERGEMVTVLNRDDQDWFWVVRSDGQEGFVPSAFVYPTDVVQAHSNKGDGQVPMPAATVNNNGVFLHHHHHNNVVNSPTYNNNNNGFGANDGTMNNNNNNVGSTGGSIGNTMHDDSGSMPVEESASMMGMDEVRRGTELVLLYDYKAQASDDLTVRRGDWVYADMSQQTVEGWLWAYAPKLRKYGFIPKAYAKTPAMTSL